MWKRVEYSRKWSMNTSYRAKACFFRAPDTRKQQAVCGVVTLTWDTWAYENLQYAENLPAIRHEYHNGHVYSLTAGTMAAGSAGNDLLERV